MLPRCLHAGPTRAECNGSQSPSLSVHTYRQAVGPEALSHGLLGAYDLRTDQPSDNREWKITYLCEHHRIP